jgi:hypothetical protein
MRAKDQLRWLTNVDAKPPHIGESLIMLPFRACSNKTTRGTVLVIGIVLTFFVQISLAAESVHNPRVAIIMSKATFDRAWDVAQMSAHGWVGVANLAGIPYDTLFLEDLVSNRSASGYRVLVFAQCTTIEPITLKQLVPFLQNHLENGGNIVIDGPLGAFAADGRQQKSTELEALLGISSLGLRSDSTFRVQVLDNHHFITKEFEPKQYLSQMLARGLEIQKFTSGGEVLLTSTNGRESFPFLSYRTTKANRFVLISDGTTSAGATSIFRNEPPQGFFANKVVNVLTRALQWAAYGNIQGAFPAPQFSNANMAAIVRLDADNTQNLDYQKQTFKFLVDTARETGVVPLYCFVSSAGAKAGWKELAELGQELENFGGEIGSHSKFHRIESRMGAEKYRQELQGSIEEIESNMTANGARIGKVNLFINPGDTILNSDYGEVARRFEMMMTHGFEQDTPIGFGVMSWFTGNQKDFVVLDNTPSPDYQWFYDPTWSYTTAQITSYQEATFDHLFHGIGKGYIYNQMWHDYSISSMPLRHGSDGMVNEGAGKPPRIANTSNIAMYQALRSKFATNRIYAPSPMEVVDKLRALAGWNYSWTRQGNLLGMTLDLSDLLRSTTAESIGGMGVRIENTNAQIESVRINGVSHDAFSDIVVILPNLKPGRNSIQITLAEHGTEIPRLVYVSTRMPYVHRTSNGFEFQLLTRSKGRFAIAAEGPGVVLHADSQEFDLRGNQELEGYVTSDRKLQYVPLKRSGVVLHSASVPLRAVTEGTSVLRLELEKGTAPHKELVISSAKPLKRIELCGKPIRPKRSGIKYLLELPDYDAPAQLVMHW